MRQRIEGVDCGRHTRASSYAGDVDSTHARVALQVCDAQADAKAAAADATTAAEGTLINNVRSVTFAIATAASACALAASCTPLVTCQALDQRVANAELQLDDIIDCEREQPRLAPRCRLVRVLAHNPPRCSEHAALVECDQWRDQIWMQPLVATQHVVLTSAAASQRRHL